MGNDKHLPLFGVGPIYVIIIVIMTIGGLIISNMDMLKGGEISYLKIPFAILGIALIIAGILLWASVLFKSKLDDNIKSNTLVTTGVYAYVRNPCYSAFLFICTGAILLKNNCWLLFLPVVYWIFMTVLMKKTEEKWLVKLYGEQYLLYCKRVNRCIPWFRK